MADARSPSDRYRQGMATRRRVLGDAHVDRASASATPFDQPFQEMITEGAWGTVWSRPGISPRERSNRYPTKDEFDTIHLDQYRGIEDSRFWVEGKSGQRVGNILVGDRRIMQ